MKISFTRGFDTEDVINKLKAAKVEGLDEFVTNMAELMDKLSLFVQKNIGLLDNIDHMQKAYIMTHGKSLLIDQPSERKKVKAIIPTQSSGWETPLTSFNWRYTQSGKIELRAFFKDSPANQQNVTLSIFH